MQYIRPDYIQETYYQDQNGKIWRPDFSKPISWNKTYEGACSELYLQKREGTIFKSYTHGGDPISYDIFETLKTINNPNLVALLDRFYGYPTDLGTSQEGLRIDGYTKNYVKKSRNSLLKSQDYLIKNINFMESLFKEFKDHGIQVVFNNIGDITNSKTGLVITNPDAFQIINLGEVSRDELEQRNRDELIRMLKMLLMEEYSRLLFHKDVREAQSAIDVLFEGAYDCSSAMDASIEDTLDENEKPIDFINYMIR